MFLLSSDVTGFHHSVCPQRQCVSSETVCVSSESVFVLRVSETVFVLRVSETVCVLREDLPAALSSGCAASLTHS